MRAEVLSVGTELLLGQIVDTNAAYIARILSDLGITLYRRSTVGDNMDRLLAFVRRLEPLVTLAEIKASGLFADWALVRQGRLSTMAVPEKFVGWMRKRYPEVSF